MNRELRREETLHEGPNIVVCEGYSDVRFVKHLLDLREIQTFEIGCPTRDQEGIESEGKGGIAEYLQAIRNAAKSPKVTLSSVAIVIDADDDPRRSFKDACKWLESVEYPAPNAPFEWTSVEKSALRTGVLVVPGKSREGRLRKGTLQHLLIDVLRETSPNTFTCVEEFAACISGSNEWPLNRNAKMRVNATISARCSKPETSLSWIWNRNPEIFPLDHSTFDFVAEFFRQVAAK